MLLEDRLLCRIKLNGSCIEHTGKPDKDGYKRLGRNYKTVKAHRVSYEFCVGDIPPGLSVLHKCDNPPCINPAHLFVGTSDDNGRDKVAKKRHRFGEKIGWSKLREADVVKILDRRHAGESTLSISRDFPVSHSTVKYVCRRKIWKCVDWHPGNQNIEADELT